MIPSTPIVRNVARAILIIALLVIPPRLQEYSIREIQSQLSNSTFQKVVKTGMCPPPAMDGGAYPCTPQKYIDDRVFGGWASINRLFVVTVVWVPFVAIWVALYSLTFVSESPIKSDSLSTDGDSNTVPHSF